MPHAVPTRQFRVLLIGSPESIHRNLLQQLRCEPSLSCVLCPNMYGGIATALSEHPPFCAVIICTDDGDGALVRACHQLREHAYCGPILLMASAPSETEIVKGLDSGANDFLAAPIRISELLARLRAQIRTHERSEELELSVGPYHFRPAIRQLQHRQTREIVRLTDKETAVLRYLCRADGPVSRERLLIEVWGYNDRAHSHTVETHIYRLRRKIEPDPGRIGLLVNEDGCYRLQTQPMPAPLNHHPRAFAVIEGAARP